MSSKKSVTVRQLELLTEFMEKHKDLALGRVLRSKEGRALSRRLWGQLANMLNAEDTSAFRSPLEWNKFYNDYKCRIKNKNRKIAQSQSKTGGGPSNAVPLTALEERLCTILGPDNFKILPVQQNPIEITDQMSDLITTEIFEVDPDNPEIQYLEEPALSYTLEESGPSYTLEMPSTSTAAPMQSSITVYESQSGGAARAKRRKENEVDGEHLTSTNRSNIPIHESQSQCDHRAKRYKENEVERTKTFLGEIEQSRIEVQRAQVQASVERIGVEREKVAAIKDLANAVWAYVNMEKENRPEKKIFTKAVNIETDSNDENSI